MSALRKVRCPEKILTGEFEVLQLEHAFFSMRLYESVFCGKSFLTLHE